VLIGGGVVLFAVPYYYSHLEQVPISQRWRFVDVSVDEETEMSRAAYKEVFAVYGHRILAENHYVSLGQDARAMFPALVRLIDRSKSLIPQYTKLVRRIANRIISAAGMTNLNWEIYVIDSPELNAMVLPGGKIFVFTGILNVARSESSLAAVLAHEIAHQLARHSAEKLSFYRVMVIAVIAVASILGIHSNLLSKLAMFGVELPFSRKW
jgi:hypothetical protein